jgi:hypothetical protein
MVPQKTQHAAELPDKSRIIALIDKLKSCNLSRVSTQKIAIALSEGFKVLPFVQREFLEGERILRARLNGNGQVFVSEKELSYRPDVYNITTYGRASMPLQTVFYGTVVSTTLVDALNTILWETSEMFNEMHLDTPAEFVFTMGCWTAVQDIRTSEIVFCKRFIDSIPYVRQVYERYLAGYRSQLEPDVVDGMGLILSFYSDEFAKTNITDHQDYLISATYSQLLFDHQGVEGVLYPSTRVDNHGINIALQPFAVEKKLRLNGAIMAKAVVEKEKRAVIGLKYTKSLGPLHSDFTWEDIVHDSDAATLLERWLYSE